MWIFSLITIWFLAIITSMLLVVSGILRVIGTLFLGLKNSVLWVTLMIMFLVGMVFIILFISSLLAPDTDLDAVAIIFSIIGMVLLGIILVLAFGLVSSAMLILSAVLETVGLAIIFISNGISEIWSRSIQALYVQVDKMARYNK